MPASLGTASRMKVQFGSANMSKCVEGWTEKKPGAGVPAPAVSNKVQNLKIRQNVKLSEWTFDAGMLDALFGMTALVKQMTLARGCPGGWPCT